jgi:hypothetical protein
MILLFSEVFVYAQEGAWSVPVRDQTLQGRCLIVAGGRAEGCRGGINAAPTAFGQHNPTVAQECDAHTAPGQ